MAYSNWFEKNGFLSKVTMNNGDYPKLLSAITAACNDTLAQTSQTCMGRRLYQCTEALSTSKVTLFGCAAKDTIDPAMIACMETGMDNYAQFSPNNMTCHHEEENIAYWIGFGLALAFPFMVMAIYMLVRVLLPEKPAEKKVSIPI